MASSTRFFYKHAGYSYDAKIETKNQGRWRCARMLAQAEAYGQRHGFTFTWEYDDLPIDDHEEWCEPECGKNHEAFICLLDGPGRLQESLGGIIDPDKNYRRVIEAELALEMMATIEESFAEV